MGDVIKAESRFNFSMLNAFEVGCTNMFCCAGYSLKDTIYVNKVSCYHCFGNEEFCWSFMFELSIRTLLLCFSTNIVHLVLFMT